MESTEKQIENWKRSKDKLQLQIKEYHEITGAVVKNEVIFGVASLFLQRWNSLIHSQDP